MTQLRASDWKAGTVPQTCVTAIAGDSLSAPPSGPGFNSVSSSAGESRPDDSECHCAGSRGRDHDSECTVTESEAAAAATGARRSGSDLTGFERYPGGQTLPAQWGAPSAAAAAQAALQ